MPEPVTKMFSTCPVLLFSKTVNVAVDLLFVIVVSVSKTGAPNVQPMPESVALSVVLRKLQRRR